MRYHREHLDARASPIRARITEREMEMRGPRGAYTPRVSVSKERVRYALDDFEFQRRSNLMQIAELSGDNAVPREEVFPRFALAFPGAFTYGVF